MSLGESGYTHIALDAAGVPLITDTAITVVELVARIIGFGWSAAQLHAHYPDLSLGQIHSALSYYGDHEAELSDELAICIAALTPPTSVDSWLKSKGLV